MINTGLAWLAVAAAVWFASIEFQRRGLIVALVVVGVLVLVRRRSGKRPPVFAILLACVLMAGITSRGPSSTIAAGAGSQALTAGDPFGGACRPVMTQGYGPTALVGEPIVNGVRTHTGIDLACPAGTPVHTVSDGVAHVTGGDGFGNSVVVEVGNGYFVRYSHLASTAVPDGATVHTGDVIGWEGSTGFSTGPHLHFEVDLGAPSVQRSVNPGPFLTVA